MRIEDDLVGLARPQRVSLLIVAPNYFTLLGVKPQLGAAFDAADATPGFNGQAVISDGLWKRAFGGDPHVLGRVVQLDSDSYRIVGVMPAGFAAPGGTREERGTQVWPEFGFAGAPLNEATVHSRASLFSGAIARLEPGLTIADAQRRVDVLVRALRQQYPAAYPPGSDWRVRLVPLKTTVAGDVRQPLLFLLGAVALVRLIGCANVAGLSLARATTRGRELAVRRALGAEPSRVARQLLTESVVLSVLGGIAGVAVLLALKEPLARVVPASVPRLDGLAGAAAPAPRARRRGVRALARAPQCGRPAGAELLGRDARAARVRPARRDGGAHASALSERAERGPVPVGGGRGAVRARGDPPRARAAGRAGRGVRQRRGGADGSSVAGPARAARRVRGETGVGRAAGVRQRVGGDAGVLRAARDRAAARAAVRRLRHRPEPVGRGGRRGGGAHVLAERGSVRQARPPVPTVAAV